MREITNEYLASQGLSKTFPQRFWAKVRKTESCWLWTASTFHTGYGQIGRGGRGRGMMTAHRASWMIHFGPVPDGLCVLHRCDVKRCVNPDHLWLGTNSDNSEDMIQKGRSTFGEKNPNSKLTQADVEQIRKLRPSTKLVELGSAFGVSFQHVSLIVKGKRWGNPI